MVMDDMDELTNECAILKARVEIAVGTSISDEHVSLDASAIAESGLLAASKLSLD